MTRSRPLAVPAVLLALLAAGSGCTGGARAPEPAPDPLPAIPEPSAGAPARIDAVPVAPAGDFDPQALYEREAPGVVTVIALFDEPDGAAALPGEGDGVGSGFVLSGRGEVVTNAHVVTAGEGAEARPAREVYVEFADSNKVRAEVVGRDLDSDLALLRVDPAGLRLRPLPLGRSDSVQVGQPVAAIGSPFGERQSLSIGVVSAIDRSIRSLTAFDINGAIQTDAAINPGNSGGPLVDARGRVIGVNQQIRSTTGGGEGVGYAVPVDLVRRSIRHLREDGSVAYAFLGVSTVELYPQLVERFDLPVARGAWVQGTAAGGPAARAGLRSGDVRTVSFQGNDYVPGGDVITRVGGRRVTDADDLADAVTRHEPGREVTIELWRDEKRRRIPVTLGSRPPGGPRLP